MKDDALVLRRSYAAPPERVFRAWTTRADLERWYTPEDGWPVAIVSLDLRVGGRYRAEFGPPGEDPYVETGEYLEIDPPRRLVFKTALTRGGELLAETHCTLELRDAGGRTELVLTETGAPPEVRDDRAGGWGRTLDHLPRALE